MHGNTARTVSAFVAMQQNGNSSNRQLKVQLERDYST